MNAPVDPIAIALAVTRALNALGVEHTIGGSIASSFAGEPRSSLDIDVVAARCDGRLAIGEGLVDAGAPALKWPAHAEACALRMRCNV